MSYAWFPRHLEGTLQIVTVESETTPLRSAEDRWAEIGLITRVVRGRKMRTEAALMDECAAALQFPAYFGENRDAFDECLQDLEGLQIDVGIVLAVTEPCELLAEEDDQAFSWLVRSLRDAADSWSETVAEGQWWDRGPRQFHIVLFGTSDELERAASRWAGLGASITWARGEDSEDD